MDLGIKNIIGLRDNALNYAKNLRINDTDFRFTKNSEVSPYARCFAIFIYKLLNKKELLSNKLMLSRAIKKDLNDLKKATKNNFLYNKPYMQLLTFSLSAKYILGTIDDNDLDDHIAPLLALKDIETFLRNIGAFTGTPGSGNLAMFLAVILIHAKIYMNIDTTAKINEWKDLHLKYKNINGFWGSSKNMTHLQFQNGYHQYEILYYLGISGEVRNTAATSVINLMDKDGHYAPYPGGGGCYDYDAISILSSADDKYIMNYMPKLQITLEAIIKEQNNDGGFCESHFVHPAIIKNIPKLLWHIINAPKGAQYERIRRTISILRFKNNRIHTHWTKYSRHWNESNLWDTWFRLCAIARIDIINNKNQINDWGFINYPGIGHHHLIENNNFSL